MPKFKTTVHFLKRGKTDSYLDYSSIHSEDCSSVVTARKHAMLNVDKYRASAVEVTVFEAPDTGSIWTERKREMATVMSDGRLESWVTINPEAI